MSDKIFANGMIFKLPSDRAPSFVKGSLAIKVEEFYTFLKQHENNGWVNLDLNESTKGKGYAQLNTYRSGSSGNSQPSQGFQDNSGYGNQGGGFQSNGPYGSAQQQNQGNGFGGGSFEDDIPF